MKKISLSFFLFFAFTTFLNAQKFEWAKRIGGTGPITSDQHEGNSITVDNAGNIYTTGYFSNTVDFDPGPGTSYLTSAGNNDIFASKLDASGNFVWAKRIGGSGNDVSYSVAVDAAGNVYTTGLFSSAADFDPGAGTFNLFSTGGSDIFVSKLDSSGNFIWAKQIGSLDNDISYSIAVDASGNIYTTGIFHASADFNPNSGTFNLSPVGNYDIFVSKLDASGNFVWAKQMGGTGNDIGNSVAIDTAGNVYTTGFFSDSADFDPSAGTFNLQSGFYPGIFVSKLDSAGNFLWAKKMGGAGNNEGASIAVDKSGNAYITGYFQGSADFDPGSATFNLSSSGNENIFVSKLDGSGNFVWAKQMGGNGSDRGKSITISGSGNVYITGYFGATADFGPGTEVFNLTSTGVNDVFVSKLDASGDFIWAKKLGGVNNDVGNSIVVDAEENTLTTGYFGATADFDPSPDILNLTAAGLRDIFIQKLSFCTATTSFISASACNTYSSPDSTNVWTRSGSYIAVIPNSTGCDSTISIQLTINRSSSNTIYNTICNGGQYQFGNSMLTASGTYTDTLQNIYGCDSIIVLYLTVLPPLDVSAGADIGICASDTVQLNAGLQPQAACVPYYTLTQIPYNIITPTATVTPGPSGDDLVSPGITMPFPFQFFCNAVDSYYISTNGFIAFNNRPSPGCCRGQVLPNTTEPNNLVTMIWEDLSTNSGGNINYFVSGNAPNRILIVRWNNVGYFSGGYVNGEIHLYETSNIIEIHAGAATATGQTNTIGIENATGTSGYSPWGYNSDSFTISTPVAFRFAPQTSENLLMGVYWMPTAGLTNDTILNPRAYIDTTTTYTIVAAFANGCTSYDSVTVIKTTSPVPVSIYDTINSGQSYQLGNSSYTASGIYTDTLQTINGCDSVIVLHLIVKNCHAHFTLSPDTTMPHNWWAVNQATGTGTITYNWQWGDGTGSTGAFPSHIYATAGNYNICLTISDLGGCSDTYCDSSTYIYKTEGMVTVNVVSQLPTGIPSATAYPQFTIFPNPATNQINITVDESLLGAQLNIYSLTGALITVLPLQTNNNELSTKNYPPGVYIAEIKMKNSVHRLKWVKI